jgi:hypothetical protein
MNFTQQLYLRMRHGTRICRYLEHIMKTQLTAFALLTAIAIPAFAGPCAALDYQEMKDMSVDELVKEACKANKIGISKLEKSMKNRSDLAASLDSMSDHQQCSGEIDRMLRILKSKGATEKLYVMCEQQAQGKPIVLPIESK